MNIAITGASGFIGKNLLKKLHGSRNKITVFDRNKHNIQNLNSLKSFVTNQDVIIHLAGANKDKKETEIITTNILGTQNLSAAICLYNPRAKLIFISSSQVYMKNDLFGFSKKAGENVIAYYGKKYGLKAIILRMSNIYGYGCLPFKNSFLCTVVHLVKENKPIYINGDGSQKRDYVFIDDSITAILHAISYTPKNIITLDICAGVLTSFIEIIEFLKTLLEKDIIVYNRSTKTKEKSTPKKNYSSAEKLINWKPSISLEEGIKKMLHSL